MKQDTKQDTKQDMTQGTMQDMTIDAKAAKKMRKNDPDRLGRERIGKLLFEFSLPAIIMMMFNSLYNVVDTAFLGHAVGDVGVAVTTLALPVMIILMGFSMLAGQGGSALAAIQLGEGKRDVVERTLGNTALLLFVISGVMAVVALVFIDPVLALIGCTIETTPELYEPTKAFVQIICVGSAFQSLGMGLNNFLRTAGKPNLALITGVLGTVMCIVFNFLFVIVLGWGVEGSAYATVFGQCCGMVPVVCYFAFVKTSPFKLRLSCLKPEAWLIGKILSLGVASFAMQVAGTVVSVVFNQVVAVYGALDPLGYTDAFAALGVAQKAGSFAFTPLIGLIMGAQPIIGYNYGARNWSRVLKTLKWASVVATIIMVFFWLLSHLIPEAIVSLFGVTGALQEFAILALQIYTIMFPIVGFQVVGSSYFQSSGQPLKAAILELTRQIIFLIPLYLIMPPIAGWFGITGLVMVAVCVPIADALSCVVTGIFVLVEVRKLRRWRAENPGAPAGVPDGAPAGAPAGAFAPGMPAPDRESAPVATHVPAAPEATFDFEFAEPERR